MPTINKFLTEELSLEKDNLDFKRELVSFYLNNTSENDFSKKHLQDLVFLSSGFLSDKVNKDKLNLIRNSFPNMSIDEYEKLDVKSNQLLNKLKNFIESYSFSLNNEAVVRLEERTDVNLAGVSHIAARGIWSDKEHVYTNLAPKILKLLKNYVRDNDISELKKSLRDIEFKEHSTIAPIATILNVLNPKEFLLINGFILKGLKKVYKAVTRERLPVNVNKDVNTYLSVSSELKSSLIVKDDFNEKPFFLVLDHYLALIKDSVVVDLLSTILVKNKF